MVKESCPSRSRTYGHHARQPRDRCLEAIARRLPSFEYDRHKGGFRRWLRRVAESKTADVFRKRRERPAGSAELRRVPDRSPIPSDLWERHWENEHIRYCVERVRGSVPERSYEVFRLLAFDERSVPEGCACLALNPNQVYKAKSRVLAAVRQKMAELGLDEA